MSLKFRPCRPDDVEAVIPLMYSAGPDAYRYVFSVSERLQTLEFLRYAYVQGRGEFGYRDHVVAVDDGEIVGLVGCRDYRDNLKYTLAAVGQILRFYGPIDGVRVMLRGLLFEQVVPSPARGQICLHNLAVVETGRGRGYGLQIIDWFLQHSRDRSVEAVCLEVAESNPRARALYQRLGFAVTAAHSGRADNRFGRAVAHETMVYKL